MLFTRKARHAPLLFKQGFVMNIEMYRDALKRLIDVLEARRERTIEIAVEQQGQTSLSSPVGSPTRVDRSHREFIEAIDKMLGDWEPSAEREELIGWSESELHTKFFYSLSSGICTIQSQMSYYFRAANDLGSFLQGVAQISLSDEQIGKVHSTSEAAMRIRQFADAGKSLAELLGELLELRALMLEE